METAPSFVDAFKDDPLFIFLAIVLGLVAFVGGAIALVVGGKGVRIGLGTAAALVAFAALGIGALGALRGRSNTDAANEAAGLSAHDRERITEYGYASANYSLIVGVASALPGGGLGVIAVIVALVRKPRTA